MTNPILFEINPQEAQILEMSLREDVRERHDLLLDIGASLCYKKNTTLQLNEKDLWYLRSKIEPTILVPPTTGIDLIIRIYNALFELGYKEIIGEGDDDKASNKARTDKDQASGIA
ncbi:unnamed protein product [marine sediment metagenome]|uniref:Uncharacterized protein n=1 Tax=marine sediment metagenome TaxID=412755 RepID=X1M1C7_9ZZZZ